MSRFIRSSSDLAEAKRSARGTGFTEAELAAADWARSLAEVRENYLRPTNSDFRRHTTKKAHIAKPAAIHRSLVEAKDEALGLRVTVELNTKNKEKDQQRSKQKDKEKGKGKEKDKHKEKRRKSEKKEKKEASESTGAVMSCVEIRRKEKKEKKGAKEKKVATAVTQNSEETLEGVRLSRDTKDLVDVKQQGELTRGVEQEGSIDIKLDVRGLKTEEELRRAIAAQEPRTDASAMAGLSKVHTSDEKAEWQGMTDQVQESKDCKVKHEGADVTEGGDHAEAALGQGPQDHAGLDAAKQGKAEGSQPEEPKCEEEMGREEAPHDRSEVGSTGQEGQQEIETTRVREELPGRSEEAPLDMEARRLEKTLRKLEKKARKERRQARREMKAAMLAAEGGAQPEVAQDVAVKDGGGSSQGAAAAACDAVDELIAAARLRAEALPPPEEEASSPAAAAASDAVDELIAAARLRAEALPLPVEEARELRPAAAEAGPGPCVVCGSSSSSSSSSSRSSSPAVPGQERPAPFDPRNPLVEAHDLLAYEELCRVSRGRSRRRHRRSRPWDHDGYMCRSPSPCRLRTDGAMYPTRKGAWRSRAGGVYLPPEVPDEDRSPSRSPARYLHPEDFRREPKVERRSPSYNPEPRGEDQPSRRSRPCSHSRPSRSRSRSRARRKRRRHESAGGPSKSRSPEPRDRSRPESAGARRKSRSAEPRAPSRSASPRARSRSPVYALDEPGEGGGGGQGAA